MMEVVELSLPEVKLVKPRRFNDTRGFFQQTYHCDLYAAAGIATRFVQDNWSRSCKGVLRGMHYQLKNPQAKLVAVVRGEIFDVAVDSRRGSSTFGRWTSAFLSDENGHQMFIPEGFAHGFLVLSDEADVIYKCSDFYAPGDEYGFVWSDPDVGVDWPGGIDPLVSEKDAVLPSLSNATVFA